MGAPANGTGDLLLACALGEPAQNTGGMKAVLADQLSGWLLRRDVIQANWAYVLRLFNLHFRKAGFDISFEGFQACDLSLLGGPGVENLNNEQDLVCAEDEDQYTGNHFPLS